MKNHDPDPSTIDFSPAECDAHDKELGDRVRYHGVVEKLTEYVGCDG